MKIQKLLLCIVLVLTFGCSKLHLLFNSKKPLQTESDNNSNPTLLSVQRLTAGITRLTTSSIRISCGENTHYMDSALAPLSSDIGWIACPSSTFTINENLAVGANAFHYWFKTGSTVTATSNDVSAHRGPFFVGSPDEKLFGIFSAQAAFSVAPDRIVVTDSYSDLVGSEAGAVRIYDNVGTLINTIYGEYAGEVFGGDSTLGFTAVNSGDTINLGNSHFAVTVPKYNASSGSIVAAGAVFVYDSEGVELGREVGMLANQKLGIDQVKVLSNHNLVLVSKNAPVGANTNAGIVKLISGDTGAVISTFAGDDTNDFIGDGKIIELPSGNFLLNTYQEIIGGIPLSSVRLVNGLTGAVIGMYTGTGAASSDIYNLNAIELANGNVVFSEPYADMSGNTAAGRVRIVNGTTGALIASVTNNTAGEHLGSTSLVDLKNGNFVIFSAENNLAGGITLVNASNGNIITNTILGAGTFFNKSHCIALTNGNYVAAAFLNDSNTLTDNGDVSLYNGTNGAFISKLSGATNDDQLGFDGLKALPGGNYIINSTKFDPSGALVDAGSSMLVNGSNGVMIANLTGNDASDKFGSTTRENIYPLGNGNVLVFGLYDNNGAFTQAGSATLMNGTTGAVISRVYGSASNDNLGALKPIVKSNSNYIIVDTAAVVNSVNDVGTATEYNGSTGAVIGVAEGRDAGAYFGAGDTISLSSDNNILMRLYAYNSTAFNYSGAFAIYPND